ncbi:MAG: terminase large subunit [Spirochaetaceae bacterium]|nr:terminase large subunit [Spirochaetaceae bacterium]
MWQKIASMPRRPASYYREYRRKKREAAAAAANAAPRKTAAAASADTADLAAWIEAKLRVPSGPLTGEPFRVSDWQREWLAAAFAPGVRESGLSIARKNGKSGFIAAVLLGHLIGPFARTDWRGVVASLTGPLAKELRDAMEATARVSGFAGSIKVRRAPPPGSIEGKHSARVNFLAADKATGHAIGSDLAIIDEAGLLQENKRALWNALYSSISGRDGRFWCISIQGDGPMFSEMGQRDGSPTLHWRKWSAPEDCDLDDEVAWLAANPGIADGIKSRQYMADAAARVALSPGNEMHFRAYDLNQPVDPERETIVTVRDYARCIGPDAPALSGDIVVGVDLGGSVSMTAAAAFSPETGVLITRGAFGDEPPLSLRAQKDRMGSLYDRMIRQGELRLYPGRVTPVVPFLKDFFAEIGALGTVLAVGLDRHRKAEAQQAFEDAGIHPRQVYWRGQGASATADGSHDVRAFQRLVVSRRLRTRGSVMLEAAIASSVIRYDGAGNPALNKASNEARIDALSASVIAAGLGELVRPMPLLRVHVV